MAHITADRVRETTTTTGTGALTLAGAAPGFRTFASVLSSSDTCYYAIAHQTAAEWETGLGTLTGGTLARTTVLASSAAGAAVDLSAGTKDVFLTLPAARTVQLDDLLGARLPIATTTPVPPAGHVSLFGRSVAGRNLPAFVGPSGLDSILQAALGRNKVAIALPTGNATTVNTLGVAMATATGTATALNVASTNLYTSMRGLEALVTTASTSAVAGHRTNTAQWWRGNAAGLGGFTAICRWGPATGVATTTNRSFCGFRGGATAPTDVEPSSIASIIGMGWDAADTNVQVMHNDASGSATKVNLGASFPVPTTDRSAVYELALFAAPNASTVGYQVTNLVTGAVATGTISTDLPASTTFMSWHICSSAGGTSSVIGVAYFSLYIETDY